MNEVLMRMRDRNKNMQTLSIYPHLTVLLKDLSVKSKQNIITEDLHIIGNLNIKFAESGKRIREIVRRSNARMTGKFPSTKNNRMMHWESQYELETFQILEISPLVAAYNEQPAEFKYLSSDGILHMHYPDILVTLSSGNSFFIEVKPQNEETNQLLAERTALLTSLLRPMGYGYIMILPEQINSLAYLENAKQLLRYSKSPMPETIWEIARNLFIPKKIIQFSTLVSLINHPYAKSWIYQLIMAGDIQIDLSELITDATFLGWNHWETV